jgi:hypothetical protein
MAAFLYICAILCAVIGVLFAFPLIIVAIFIAGLGAMVQNTRPQKIRVVIDGEEMGTISEFEDALDHLKASSLENHKRRHGHAPSQSSTGEPPMPMADAYRKAQEAHQLRAARKSW